MFCGLNCRGFGRLRYKNRTLAKSVSRAPFSSVRKSPTMGQKKSKSEGASKSKEPSNPLFVSGSTEESKPQAKETAPAAKETPKPRFLGPGWDKLNASEQRSIMLRWKLAFGGVPSLRTEEFYDIFVKGGMDPELARLAVRSYDSDGDGWIDVYEFRSFLAITLKGTEEDKLRATFDAFDTNGDGSLSRDELKVKVRSILKLAKFADGLENNLNAEVDTVVDQIFDKMDTDKSGGIDEEEFVQGFLHNAEVTATLKEAALFLTGKTKREEATPAAEGAGEAPVSTADEDVVIPYPGEEDNFTGGGGNDTGSGDYPAPAV